MGQSLKNPRMKKQDVFFFFRITRLGSERLTMGFVFLRFGTSTLPHLSSAAPNGCSCSWRMGAFHLPANSGRAGEESSLNLSHAARRLLSAQVGIQTKWEGLDESGRWQRSRLLVAAWERLLRGRQRDARSRRHSCQMSHLWLCSIITPLVRRTCNQQAPKIQVWLKSVLLLLLVLVVLVVCRFQTPKLADWLNFSRFNSMVSLKLLLWTCWVLPPTEC